MNAMKNNPVTFEDVNIYEIIFGSGIRKINYKTTRIKPNPVISDYIDIPKELIEKHQYITQCINNMFIDGIVFLQQSFT
jgi:hypothetical protein